MAPDWPTIVLSIATNVSISLVALKLFATKWLEHRFAAQLETLRHDHQAEVERLRYKIAGLLDRSARLNQREFEVLPEIWEKANEAHSAIMSLIARFKMSADLTNMGDAQLESFISNCDLQDWQKDELRQKGKYERSTYYANAIWAKSLSDTHFAAQEFRRSVLRNSIYLRPDVFKQIEAFANRICEVVFNYQLDWQAKSDGVYNTKEDDVIQAYREAGKDQYERLGEYLRNHYWEVKTL